MKSAVKEHSLSLTGQLAAALPPIVVLVVLSRNQGLEAAGRFAIVVGVSAACFSIAHWGLRTAVVIDRFKDVGPANYLAARLMMLTAAAITVLAMGVTSGAGTLLVGGLILFKICDGLLDIEFAFTQVTSGTSPAVILFTRQHLMKLLLLGVAMAAVFFLDSVAMSVAYVASGVVALTVIALRLARQWSMRNAASWKFQGVRRALAKASWFAVAIGICAIVTSAPRIAIPWLYQGDWMGVVGVTLSVGTLFGMAYQTAWTRQLPRFGAQRSFRLIAVKFLLENMAITAAAALVSWLLLSKLVGVLYGYAATEYLLLTRQVLLGTVVFFAGMNTCNLFKVTGRPWLESVAYAVALSVAVALAFTQPALRDMHLLLMLAGLVMFAAGLAALLMQYRDDKSMPAGANAGA